MTDRFHLLTIAQVARRTPYSEAQIRSQIRRGELRAVRIGGRLFLTEAELIRALGRNYQPSDAPAKRKDKQRAFRSLLRRGGRALVRPEGR